MGRRRWSANCWAGSRLRLPNRFRRDEASGVGDCLNDNDANSFCEAESLQAWLRYSISLAVDNATDTNEAAFQRTGQKSCCMKLPQTCLVIGALLSALFLSGCATITRGTTEEFMVQSNPSGANVRLDTGQTGITPATFTVPRKRDIIVTVSSPGYKSHTQTETTKIAGRGAAGIAGNVLVGGIIGIGVDAVSGASLNHTPNPLIVNLVAESTADPLADQGKPAENPAAASEGTNPKIEVKPPGGG